MKKAMLSIALLLASASASATTIHAARYNSATDALEFDVSYGGGCKDHKFELQVGMCLESYPVRCGAKLVDLTTNDYCEAMLSETVSITLQEAGLNDAYYNGASLTVSSSGTPKGTLVVLPRK